MSVDVYRQGLVHASVCVPLGMSREQIEEEVNRQSPTGIPSRWKISDDEQFSGGEPMPCPCKDDPDRRHWLLCC